MAARKGIRLEADGLDEMARYIQAVGQRSADFGEMSRNFKRYVMGARMENLWRNEGIIRGRWGKGSKRWPANTSWTARAKGHKRVLYGRSQSKSGLRQGYTFDASGAMVRFRQGRFTFKLGHEAPYWRALQRGRASTKVVYGVHSPAKVLMIPLQKRAREPGKKWGAKRVGGQWVIFRRYAFIGPQKPRKFVSFVEGDVNWLGHWFLNYAMDGKKKP